MHKSSRKLGDQSWISGIQTWKGLLEAILSSPTPSFVEKDNQRKGVTGSRRPHSMSGDLGLRLPARPLGRTGHCVNEDLGRRLGWDARDPGNTPRRRQSSLCAETCPPVCPLRLAVITREAPRPPPPQLRPAAQRPPDRPPPSLLPTTGGSPAIRDGLCRGVEVTGIHPCAIFIITTAVTPHEPLWPRFQHRCQAPNVR